MPSLGMPPPQRNESWARSADVIRREGDNPFYEQGSAPALLRRRPMSLVDRVRVQFRATRTRVTRLDGRLRGLPRGARDLYSESSLVRVAELGKSQLAVTPRWSR